MVGVACGCDLIHTSFYYSIYASQALPGGEPELNLYKEQLKTALEGYKVTMTRVAIGYIMITL